MKTKIILERPKEYAEGLNSKEFETVLEEAILLALKDSGRINYTQYEKLKDITGLS